MSESIWPLSKPILKARLILIALCWRPSVSCSSSAFPKFYPDDADFLDHLLRETPSKKLINLRRSYFARTGESQDRSLLGGGIEAMKGVYQSLRMAEVWSISL